METPLITLPELCPTSNAESLNLPEAECPALFSASELSGSLRRVPRMPRGAPESDPDPSQDSQDWHLG
eukprot:6465772-Alexandrium_andersonii.AAC.1